MHVEFLAMQDKIVTQLKICRLSNSKSNFTELGWEYDVDWRTVKPNIPHR